MRRLAWVLALALPVSGAAFARDQNEVGDVNVFVKGGMGGFTGDLSSVAKPGPAWGVTLNLQPWNILGLELGYDGSRHVVANEASAVLRNGGTALLKLGLPFIEKVKPFVAGGMTATYVSATGETNAVRSDFMEEVPVLGGVEFNLGSVTAGVRGGYRFLIDEGFATSAPNNGGLIDVTASLGGRF